MKIVITTENKYNNKIQRINTHHSYLLLIITTNEITKRFI